MRIKRLLSKEKQKLRYIASDWISTSVAFFLFNIFRYYYCRQDILSSLTEYLDSTKLVIEQLLFPPGILFIYWLSGFYNHPFHKSRLHELTETTVSTFMASAIIYFLVLTNDMGVSLRSNLVLPGVLFLILLLCVYFSRLSITLSAVAKFKKAQWSFTTIIVGNSEKSREMAQQLRDSEKKFGYNVIGFSPIPGESDVKDDAKVFPIEDLEEICRRYDVRQFVICPERYNDKTVLNLLNHLFHIGIPIKIAPDSLSYITSSIHLDDIYGEPLVDLTAPRLADWQTNVKSLLDVVISTFAVILLLPLYLIVAIAVKRDSPGPVLYTQERIGRLQRPFKIIKFRTMRTDAEKDGPQLSSDNDPRITSTGKILRKYRLDEIPQFFNVIKGDMSLVGPRPERKFFIERIIDIAPYYSLVFQVRPGITSWGMVKYGYASNVAEMVKRTKYDLIYISNMSISLDFKIIIYTIKTIFKGSGK